MKIKHKLFLILAFFLIYLLIYLNSKTLSMDEIWNYGFAYNISSGLVPYRDFNMIITPLYSYLLALLILVFGNKYLIMIIFNAFIASVIQYVFYQKSGLKSLILLPCILFIDYSGYNLLSLMLFIIFLNIKESRYQDYLIGLIMAFLILTKQTVGGLLLIVSFINSKNKIHYLIGFLPLCLIFLGYLLFTNSLYLFFDYCLFGMFDFTGGNSLGGIDLAIIFYLILLGYLIYLNIKNKFKDKYLRNILVFQVISAPIFDITHVMIAVIPFLGYLLNKKTNNKMEKQISLALICFYSFIAIFMTINLELSNKKEYYYDDIFLGYKQIYANFNPLLEMHGYINKEYSNYHVYHLYVNAYLYKLLNLEVINKFDLTNVGNMGYKGEEKYIKEIDEDCRSNKCLLIIDDDINNGSQLSIKIRNYVTNNYQFDKNTYNMDIYTNT